ncbi:phage head spike fiber domain-containing protein [Aeromonas veronii]|uniref:phage head spike fiber domain-containing protein n=1 Tax=Aeromonas veronii TaxID=654 RepID=UPI003C6EFED7
MGLWGEPSIYCGSNGGLGTKLTGVYVGNGWWRMQAALIDPLGNIGFGYTNLATETTPVWVCNFQLEALPFASSYIPTSGAAVTRAEDVVTIPAPNNITALGYTVAVEFDTLRGAASTAAENACIFAMEQDYRARIGIIRGKYGGGDPDYGFSTYCGALGQVGYTTAVLKNYAVKDTKGIAVVSEGGGLLKMRINSALTSISSASATSAQLPNNIRIGAYGDSGQMALFGHVKNFRGWLRTFSDEKMKAVA